MYYIVFLTGLMLSIIGGKKKKSTTIFLVILLLLAFFRYGVGADYFSYSHHFDRLSYSIMNELKYPSNYQEVLFRLFGSTVKKIGFSYEIYIVILSSINLGYIYKTVCKFSWNPTLSLLVYYSFYYFVWTLSGLRQGLTVSIGLYYLLDCLEKNNTIKLIIISLLLSMVHSSAIILIFLYFFANLNLSKSKFIYLFLSANIITLFPIERFLGYFSGFKIIDSVIIYMNQGSIIESLFGYNNLLRISFFILGLFIYEPYSNKSKISKQIMNIYMISLILYFLLKGSELTAARISIYGVILIIIILPNMYYLYQKNIDRILHIIILSAFTLFYLNKELHTMKQQSGLVKNDNVIVPYTHLFDKNKYEFIKYYRFYD